MPQDLLQAAGIQPPTDLLAALGTTAVRSSEPNKTNIFDDFMHQLPLVDKADAALQTTGLASGGVPGDGWSDRYHKNLTNVRNNYQDFEEVHPTQAKVAKAAGVIAPMLAMVPEGELASGAAANLPKAAPTLARATLKSGATGAGFGAAYGFSGTNDESVRDDLKATGLGAAVGLGTGLAAPAGMGIALSPFRMGGKLIAPFTKQGRQVAAGRALNEAAENPGATNFEAAPLPDMHLSAGQSSNDPGLLWLEHSVSQGSPQGEALARSGQTKNNSAIRGAISELGDDTSDAARGMSDALDRSYAARKKANGEIWKKADVSNTGGVSGFQFNNFMKKYVGGLPVADQAQVPQDVMGIMEKVGAAKTQNLSDVQSIRSMLSSRATMAARAGDGNTARILGGMADQVENFVDMKAANLGEKLPLYNEARAHTRDMKETFAQPPAVRSALGVDSYGADKIPISATADHFINSGKGAPEKFNSYLNAIGTKDPKTGTVTYDPAGLSAAQDAFTQKFLGAVTNAGVDQNGSRLVSPAKMQKFMSDYSHVINSPAFIPAQRDLMGSIARATQMASRAGTKAPAGGSDTFAKLQGDKFIDALIGPAASKIINAAGTGIGAATGYISHGLTGGAAGAFGGEKVAGMLSNLYSAPRDKVMSIITEAMHDPQMAKDLMMKASNTNAKLLPPPRRAKIFGVLGAQAAQPVVNAVTAPQ